MILPHRKVRYNGRIPIIITIPMKFEKARENLAGSKYVSEGKLKVIRKNYVPKTSF